MQVQTEQNKALDSYVKACHDSYVLSRHKAIPIESS